MLPSDPFRDRYGDDGQLAIEAISQSLKSSGYTNLRVYFNDEDRRLWIKGSKLLSPKKIQEILALNTYGTYTPKVIDDGFDPRKDREIMLILTTFLKC